MEAIVTYSVIWAPILIALALIFISKKMKKKPVALAAKPAPKTPVRREPPMSAGRSSSAAPSRQRDNDDDLLPDTLHPASPLNTMWRGDELDAADGALRPVPAPVRTPGPTRAVDTDDRSSSGGDSNGD